MIGQSIEERPVGALPADGVNGDDSEAEQRRPPVGGQVDDGRSQAFVEQHVAAEVSVDEL